MDCTFGCVISFWLGSVVCGTRWIRGGSQFDNLIRSDGSDFAVRSLLDCGKECARGDTCSGFSHSKSLKLCQLHPDSLSPGMDTSMATMRFYERCDEVSTTSTTMPATSIATAATVTTTVPSSSSSTPAPLSTQMTITCPTLDSFTTVQFLDGGFYDVLITQALHTKEVCNTYCTSHAATMANVNTMEKQTTLSLILLHCPGLTGTSYWIDGEKDNHGNWLYANSTPMPLDDTALWASGSPRISGSGATENCVIMKTTENYRWDNAGCAEHHGVICLKDTVTSSTSSAATVISSTTTAAPVTSSTTAAAPGTPSTTYGATVTSSSTAASTSSPTTAVPVTPCTTAATPATSSTTTIASVTSSTTAVTTATPSTTYALTVTSSTATASTSSTTTAAPTTSKNGPLPVAQVGK